MKKEIIIQIFTGGYTESKTTFEQIERKLKPILEVGKVKRVMMGWSLQPELYRKASALVRSYGTEFFLWMPVFSETGLVKPVKRLIDDLGAEVKSYGLKEGENFEFYCPLDRVNINSFLELYEENFDGQGFDGIFLDKIRYGAFSNGLSGVFNCFCPVCEQSYEETGFSMKEIRAEMEKVRAGSDGYDGMPLKITGYEGGVYEFQNDLWKRFFQKKQDNIVKTLTELTNYFHLRGMLVGMDTFSPFTAYFAGQDVVRLLKLADFIKPMMYRITNAPAGLPFEADCLIRESTKGRDAGYAGGLAEDEKEHIKKVRTGFYQKIRCREPEKESFDLQFVVTELKSLTGHGIPVYAGVEFNKNEAASADPAYMKENLDGLWDTGIEGFVMSWDLLTAPEENIDAVIRYLKS